MDYLNDEQIIQMTEEFCNHNLKDINNMLRSEYTFSSFMDGLCSWLELAGYHFRFDSLNGIDTFVIPCDRGRKWSLYKNPDAISIPAF